MNIAIYARVSSDTQAKEGTIRSQIEALREYAKTHDLAIIHECIDLPRKLYPSKMRVERPKKEQLSHEATQT